MSRKRKILKNRLYGLRIYYNKSQQDVLNEFNKISKKKIAMNTYRCWERHENGIPKYAYIYLEEIFNYSKIFEIDLKEHKI